MGQNLSKGAAAAHAASEAVCIVIGIDGDGTLRVAAYNGGHRRVLYAPQRPDFLVRGTGLPALVREMVAEAREGQAAATAAQAQAPVSVTV